jgi:membrane protein DedA with SNARE-associated domain
MHWLAHGVRDALNSWGYWAVLIGLLGEDAGLPLPGETVLMFASFVANKNSGLQLHWARKLLHLDDIDIDAARDLIHRHGGRTIFFSRFIFGLRTIAGPVAGSLGMKWKRFVKYNAAGAATWVCTITFIGYGFANEFKNLLSYVEKASWGISAALFLTGYLIWRRAKHQYRDKQRYKEHPNSKVA